MRVIVTRPARDATPWVQALQAQGFDALALPLIDIQTLPEDDSVQQAWAQLASYDALMFVSANAVAGFFEARASQSSDAIENRALASSLRCWATGPGTTRALRLAGVDAARIDAPPPDAPTFDSEALWAVVQTRVQAGQRVLVVRGTDAQRSQVSGVGRDWLTRQLQAAGVQVDTAVSYERRCPSWTPAQAQRVQHLLHHSVWVFSSSEALANLQSLLPQQRFDKAQAVATHPRIAQAAEKAGFGVVIQSQPDLNHVMLSIKSMA